MTDDILLDALIRDSMLDEIAVTLVQGWRSDVDFTVKERRLEYCNWLTNCGCHCSAKFNEYYYK